MAQLRFAARSLARTPLLTLVVVVSLGLGIGANTAIFSILYQVVLRSLPVQQPERLVLLQSPPDLKSGRSSSNDAGGPESIFSYPVMRALERNPQGMEGVAGFRRFEANLAFGNQTLNESAQMVTGGFFPLLRVAPMMGRAIDWSDDRGAGNPVAVLSYGYWKDKLGGNTAILNQPIRINAQPFTIVGVAPRNFTGTVLGAEPAVYVPMIFTAQLTPGRDPRANYDDYWIYMFGRLKPGVSREQGQSALNTVYAGIVEEQAKATKGRDEAYRKRFLASRLTLKDGSQGQSSFQREGRTPILILMGATALVLLIAMANAANLMLARSAQRRKELAIRAALGAGRASIMKQLLAEALLMAGSGGVLGIVLGYWTAAALVRMIGDGDSKMYGITAALDWPVLLFSLGVSLASGLFFGLYPAWDAARTSVAGTLKDAAGQTTASTGAARLRRALVCGQVAISALLLVPTGLFLKSLVNLLNVDLGIRTENVLTFGVSPELNGYKPAQSHALFERLETDLAGIPGVRSVACSLVPLISGSNWGNNVSVEGYANGPDADSHSLYNAVGPGFFGAMGIPLIAGREFTDRDNLSGPKVAVVSQEWARHFFGDQNPVGRRFALGWNNKGMTFDIEIVGVAADTKYSSVKQKPPRLYYVPYRQNKEVGALAYYVRSSLPAAQVAGSIRRVVGAADADLPIEGLRTFDEQVSRNIRTDKLVLQLAAVFAALATTLAMLGLYGVMAYSVTRRTREIGIRLALGAATGGIRMMVFRELLVILGVGLLFGVPLALALSRLTESQLFGVKAFDGLVLAAAVSALALAAVAAGYIPARRATRVNPVEALRYE